MAKRIINSVLVAIITMFAASYAYNFMMAFIFASNANYMMSGSGDFFFSYWITNLIAGILAGSFLGIVSEKTVTKITAVKITKKQLIPAIIIVIAEFFFLMLVKKPEMVSSMIQSSAKLQVLIGTGEGVSWLSKYITFFISFTLFYFGSLTENSKE